MARDLGVAILNLFVDKFESQENGCWQWTASRRGSYGRFSIQRVSVLAHRVAYEWFVCPIPSGLTIDHLCRNRLCVNPDHLEAVTMRENILRGIGTAAQNARKTECLQGHPLSGENLYIAPNGSRKCRTCQVARTREWRKERHTCPAI